MDLFLAFVLAGIQQTGDYYRLYVYLQTLYIVIYHMNKILQLNHDK